MMSEGQKKIISKIGKYKYPLIVLLAGILLMLLPTGKSAKAAASADAPSTAQEERMEYVLSGVSGAGEMRVLLSDSGAVIVCAGADDANVRLGLTEAAKAFTGFGSDDITILKLTDMSIGEAKK